MAEIQAISILMLYKTANPKNKQKLERYLRKAMCEAQATNNTYVASLYRTAYAKLRSTNQ